MPDHPFPPDAMDKREDHAFPVTWVSDAELTLNSQPVVKGLIEQGGFVVVYGPSGSGKSFFTADIAQHIATGSPWRGRKVNRGLVVYVASEAGSSILKRFVGWRDRRVGDAAERLPLAVLTRGPNLMEVQDMKRLCFQLHQLAQQAGMPLAMVVFDTLSRSIPGGDENSAKDMTMAVLAADMIRAEFGCATAYVHHSGKDPEKGARGHSALFAAADLVLRVMDNTATVEKVRDGVAGERYPFALEPIEIGVDADGEPVITCLLNASDTAAPSKRPEPTGKNQKIVLKELRGLAPDCDIAGGTSAIPKGVRLIPFERLADRAVNKFVGMPQFKARGRITEALSSLQASGYIGVHGDQIWLL
jgi:KaiC/GvpD/RAD55 family RecA-like ATPase